MPNDGDVAQNRSKLGPTPVEAPLVVQQISPGSAVAVAPEKGADKTSWTTAMEISTHTTSMGISDTERGNQLHSSPSGSYTRRSVDRWRWQGGVANKAPKKKTYIPLHLICKCRHRQRQAAHTPQQGGVRVGAWHITANPNKAGAGGDLGGVGGCQRH